MSSRRPASAAAANAPARAEATVPHIRVGTRGSALALAQSGTVADALRTLGATVELVRIRTAGDTRAPNSVWGEGAFVIALEAALLDGRIDVAVHSAKDVPTTQDARAVIAAYPAREDPRDALVTMDRGVTLSTLPRGARVGTDSPRRVAFLLAHRPDLRPHPLHGNVDTRLRRLAGGESDALILAAAGLIRLDMAERITQALPPEVMPPAPGQGALALQCRADDPIARPLLERLDDPATHVAVEAERAFLAAVGGGCRAPLGALGTVRDGTLELLVGAADPADIRAGDAPAGAVAAAPGTTFTAGEPRIGPVRVVWARRSAAAGDGTFLASVLAREVAAAIDRHAVRLASRSAADLEPVGAAATGMTAALRHPPAARHARPPRVLVTRDLDRAEPLLGELRARGLDPVHVPTIAVKPVRGGGPLDEAASSLAAPDWVVVTSAAGAEALGAAAARREVDLSAVRIASVGAATTAALVRAGGRSTFEPAVASAAALADELPVAGGARVLLVRGDLADGRLGDRLRARGAAVREVVAYHTVEAPIESAEPLRAALRDGVAALVFTSGSTVRGLLALLEAGEQDAVRALPAFCIGPSTASVARSAGFETVRVSEAPDPGTLAELVRAGLAADGGTRSCATIEREMP